jgi:hypothetical protein
MDRLTALMPKKTFRIVGAFMALGALLRVNHAHSRRHFDEVTIVLTPQYFSAHNY